MEEQSIDTIAKNSGYEDAGKTYQAETFSSDTNYNVTNLEEDAIYRQGVL